MRKAIAVVQGSTPSQNQMEVVCGVTVMGDYRYFQVSVLVDFARSIVQITNDIKTKVAQEVQNQGGPAFTASDVLLFGGPS